MTLYLNSPLIYATFRARRMRPPTPSPEYIATPFRTPPSSTTTPSHRPREMTMKYHNWPTTHSGLKRFPFLPLMRHVHRISPPVCTCFIQENYLSLAPQPLSPRNKGHSEADHGQIRVERHQPGCACLGQIMPPMPTLQNQSPHQIPNRYIFFARRTV